jgi:hypothetical protein
MASSGLIQFRPNRLKISSGAPLVFEVGPYLNIFHKMEWKNIIFRGGAYIWNEVSASTCGWAYTQGGLIFGDLRY